MSQGHLACLLVTFWNEVEERKVNLLQYEVEEREGELVAIRGGGGGEGDHDGQTCCNMIITLFIPGFWAPFVMPAAAFRK